MIQSLSGRQKKSALRKKRVFMILFFVVIILSWTFIRPIFLTVLDPFVSLYFKTSSSLYNTKEKTTAYFRTKEDSLSYIKQLEDENSRLHNKLALFENTNCLPSQVNILPTIQKVKDQTMLFRWIQKHGKRWLTVHVNWKTVWVMVATCLKLARLRVARIPNADALRAPATACAAAFRRVD